ncbi:MAG: hypothetical protein ABJE95_18970 [Byssovorax sp.]
MGSYVHLGIDYGTSASKVIFRDYDAPGGEKSYPLLFNGSFRIPSDLAIVGKQLYFGFAKGDQAAPRDAIWYQSVKMRVAVEHEAILYGAPFAQQSPPDGWTFEDLATLSVAWLIKKAREAAAEIITRKTKLEFGMTLGVPSDLLYSATTRDGFLKIAMAAWHLDRAHAVKGDEVLLNPTLRQHVHSALIHALPPPKDQEIVDHWLRSEARSSIWWAWETPELESEPYVKIDIGAGTTNTAAFLITAAATRSKSKATVWRKTGIAVFGAASGTVGMNILLATPNATNIFAPVLSSTPRGSTPLQRAFEQPYRSVFGKIHFLTKNNPAATAQWRRTRLIMLGGGSVNIDACSALRFDPFNQSNNFAPIIFKRLPGDLQQIKNTSAAHQSARLSLTVAYGLSVINDALPSERLPGEMIPVEKLPPRRGPTTLAGIYDK